MRSDNCDMRTVLTTACRLYWTRITDSPTTMSRYRRVLRHSTLTIIKRTRVVLVRKDLAHGAGMTDLKQLKRIKKTGSHYCSDRMNSMMHVDGAGDTLITCVIVQCVSTCQYDDEPQQRRGSFVVLRMRIYEQ